MEKIICSYGCGKEAKFFFKTGKGCCEKSPNSCEGKRNRDSEKKKGNFKGTPYWMIPGCQYKSWNKGITKDDDIRLFNLGKKISEKLKNNPKVTGKALTPEDEESRKRKISESMKKNPSSGGIRKGSGRGKKGWYRGYWCDSSWELAWVIYNIEHDIDFIRNSIGFEYEYVGQKRKYYPDFQIAETYYEIKGRRSFEKMDEENKEKVRQFKYNLVILYEKEIRPYLNYVIGKYGKDFVKLYE